MQTSFVSARRQRAVQAYAALCAMTGISGVVLSLWVHPVETAARQQQVALQPPVSAPGIVPVDAASDDSFRGIHLVQANAL